MDVRFLDRMLKCSDCREDFVFTAGEQLFFSDKQFKNDPKRCKPCKSKRSGLAAKSNGAAAALLRRTETRTECSACGIDTTVPFKPTQGRPVLCRECFQAKARMPQMPVPSPFYADPTAAALTALSEDTHGTVLTSDAAVIASSSMATAHAHSSVATPADLASISGPAYSAQSRPGSVPANPNQVEVIPISLVEATRRENTNAPEFVALDAETVLA